MNKYQVKDDCECKFGDTFIFRLSDFMVLYNGQNYKFEFDIKINVKTRF